MYSIYEIVNRINGRAYIGATKLPLNERYRYHKSRLRYNRGSYSDEFRKDWFNHGEHNFIIQLIEEVEDDKQQERELWWIKNSFKPYNLTENTVIPTPKHTEATKKRISEKMADRKFTEQHKRRISEAKTILDADSVIEIRDLYSTGRTTYRKLAEEYGVSKDTIARVVKGVGIAYG